MTLSDRKCHFLYKKKVGRTLLYEVSPYGLLFILNIFQKIIYMPFVPLCIGNKAKAVVGTLKGMKGYCFGGNVFNVITHLAGYKAVGLTMQNKYWKFSVFNRF